MQITGLISRPVTDTTRNSSHHYASFGFVEARHSGLDDTRSTRTLETRFDDVRMESTCMSQYDRKHVYMLLLNGRC